MMRWLWVAALLSACDVLGPDLTQLKFACESSERCASDPTRDADAGGASDAGPLDSGTDDGGRDAGLVDAGVVDGGSTDAAVVDAGAIVDGGRIDAGSVGDAGCASGTWCWAGPQQHALRAIAANSPDDYWAVGDLGTIVRFDARGVREVDSGTLDNLYGVWALGPSLAWAVGNAGTALRFSGAQWSPTFTTTTNTLRSVSGTNLNDVWAVGDLGTMQHFTGTAWSAVPSGTTQNLLCVRARTSTEAWASGFDGTLLRWNGTSWSSVSIATRRPIVAILLLAPDEVLVATDEGLVFRRTPTGFVTHSQVVLNLRALHGISPNDLWAFGMRGGISRWNGTTWTAVDAPVRTSWMAASGQASFNLVGEGGSFLRWDSINQFFFSLRAVEPDDLTALLGFAEDDLWAVGHAGLVRHFDGTAWTSTRMSSRDDLYAIAGAASNDLWASGGGALFRWRGAAWQQYPPLPCAVLSMHARAVDDVWAVGALGCAMHWNGTGWASSNVGLPNVTLRGVLARASNEVWVVGDSGTAFRFDGATWSSTNTQTTTTLHAVFAVNGEVIAVGGQFATALRYRQGAWSVLTTQLQGGFRGGTPDGAGGFFGVGTPLDTSSRAPVLRHDGVSFSSELSAPVREALQATWLAPSGTLWVAGTGGALLYRPP